MSLAKRWPSSSSISTYDRFLEPFVVSAQLRTEIIESLPHAFVGLGKVRDEKGLAVTIAALDGLAEGERASWCLSLGVFRDVSVLDWIERRLHEPLTHVWGDLAALSGLDWDRCARWLESGRPFSLVALDALVACSGPRRNQSFIVQRAVPRLRGEVEVGVIARALEEYAGRDRSPRVRKAVGFLIPVLSVVLGR